MSTVVSLKSVSVVRSGNEILSNLSLEIAAGQHWVVIGPNGAGKTTLMTLLSTIAFPTSGEIRLLGEQMGLTDVFELRPRIGISSASLANSLAENLHVLDAVRTAAFGMTDTWREEYYDVDNARAMRLLQEWGMAGFEDRTIATLSEGERKRVLIARALMTDPELLLLDEPTAGMDIVGREKLVRQLGWLTSSESAPTTLLVTHHVEEIPVGATHVLILGSGKQIAAGTIDAVLTSENLTTAFSANVKLEQLQTSHGRRWSARIV